jgi:hypothetical protein
MSLPWPTLTTKEWDDKLAEQAKKPAATTPLPGSDRFVWGEFKIVKPPPTPKDEDETAHDLSDDWDESEHPRDDGGRFATSGEVGNVRGALIKTASLVAGVPLDSFPDSETHPQSLAIRGRVKIDINADLAHRVSKDPAFREVSKDDTVKFVRRQIDLWAETSGDSVLPAVQMQRAVKEEFGLAEATMSHMTAPIRPKEDVEARNRAFVRAEYTRTQEWFKAQGITHVSVFRGMGDPDDALGSGIETVTMQPASSWTTDLKTAVSFARDQAGPAKILTARVPVADVLSTCVTGRGCLPEEEIILLGRPQTVRIFSGEKDEQMDQYVFPVERIRKTLG